MLDSKVICAEAPIALVVTDIMIAPGNRTPGRSVMPSMRTPTLERNEVKNCTCHRESGSHEACCGHDQGRDPDCPFHGDGFGPHALHQPIRRSLKEIGLIPTQKA